MVRIPTHRAPTHPGEMLLEEFLKPYGLTQTELAERLAVSYPRVNERVHGNAI
jgi:addiction module HigA family antidote